MFKIRAKTVLKINWPVKTPCHLSMDVSRSGYGLLMMMKMLIMMMMMMMMNVTTYSLVSKTLELVMTEQYSFFFFY